jgi:hypothetical protein
MNIRYVVICLILGLLYPAACSFAQEDSLYCGHKHYTWHEFVGHRSPTLTLKYGAMNSSLEGLSQPFFSPRSGEISIGGLRSRETEQSDAIIQQRYDYLFLGVATKDLGGKVKQGEIGFTGWHAGCAWEDGLGYKFGSSADSPTLALLSSEGVQWTGLSMREGITNSADSALWGMYEEGVRFGTRSSAVVRLRITPMLCLDGSYERSVVYRRHKFWPWLVSAAVEGAGQWCVDEFVDRILDSSPAAAPIVNFVLKNAVAYGVYELRKKDGNWPFASEAPMSNETFQVGLTFVF